MSAEEKDWKSPANNVVARLESERDEVKVPTEVWLQIDGDDLGPYVLVSDDQCVVSREYVRRIGHTNQCAWHGRKTGPVETLAVKKTDPALACDCGHDAALFPERSERQERRTGMAPDTSRNAVERLVAGEDFEDLAGLFHAETGMLAPGKDDRVGDVDPEVRKFEWQGWLRHRRQAREKAKDEALLALLDERDEARSMRGYRTLSERAEAVEAQRDALLEALRWQAEHAVDQRDRIKARAAIAQYEEPRKIHRWTRSTPQGEEVVECLGFTPGPAGHKCGRCGFSRWKHTDANLVDVTDAAERRK